MSHRTGRDEEFARCDIDGKMPAHECLWVVAKGNGTDYAMRRTFCASHEHECDEHMQKLSKRSAS